MGGWRSAAAGLLALALLASGDAHASQEAISVTRIGPDALRGGPVLAGNYVLWAEENGHRMEVRRSRISRRSSQRREVRVYAGRRPRGSEQDIPAISASASRFAVVHRTYREEGGPGGGTDIQLFADLRAGPIDGPLRRLAGRSSAEDCQQGEFQPSAVDFDGDLLAYIETPECLFSYYAPGKLILRNLRSGSPTSEVLSEGAPIYVNDVQIAGRFVAWRSSHSEITVFDRLVHADAYRARLSEKQDLTAFDLQRDGKIAVLYRDYRAQDARDGLDWYSPAEPHPHNVPMPAQSTPYAGAYRVRLVSDRIGFVRIDPEVRHAVVVTTLEGQTLVSRRFPFSALSDTVAPAGWDFDGRRLLWSKNRAFDRPTRVFVVRAPR